MSLEGRGEVLIRSASNDVADSPLHEREYGTDIIATVESQIFERSQTAVFPACRGKETSSERCLARVLFLLVVLLSTLNYQDSVKPLPRSEHFTHS